MTTKLMLVSNNLPDRRPLSEYGYHLAQGLEQANPDGEVLIMSGRHPAEPESPMRAWDYGSIRIPWQINEALKQHSPDAVLINTHFTNWGGTLANFAGLVTPWLIRRAGFRTITLVHHLPQTIDAKRAGYRLTPVHRMAIDVACRAIAKSDTVCFLMERDLMYFRKAYSPKRVELMDHGILGKPFWCPPPEQASTLAFGNWGRSKNPEPLLRVFNDGRVQGKLMIAGNASHTRPGYMDMLKQAFSAPNIAFTGYVPEEQLPSMFQQSSIVVFPYEENTGVSGVLMQTCQYGRVPLLRRLPVFEDLVNSLGLHAYFYETEDDLAVILNGLLAAPSLLAEGGFANFEAVRHLTMDKVADPYWSLAKGE